MVGIRSALRSRSVSLPILESEWFHGCPTKACSVFNKDATGFFVGLPRMWFPMTHLHLWANTYSIIASFTGYLFFIPPSTQMTACQSNGLKSDTI